MTDHGANRRSVGKGYVEVHAPGHPLAKADGWVREHRKVLYDAIGPADPPCYWCGWVLPWQSERGQDWHIVVDHLNEVRDDNRVTNLVPACNHCNMNRSWSRIAPRAWHYFLDEHRYTHPAERESGIHWLADRLELQLPDAIRAPLVPRDPQTGRAVLGGAARRSRPRRSGAPA